jgi:flagellar motility protein MotE (MotC chaperone)
MKKLLTSGWLIPVVGSLLYLGTTFMLLDPSALTLPKLMPTGTGETVEEESALASTPWDFSAPEVDGLINELKDQKAKLAVREKELDEWQARIQAEQTELTTVTQQVHRLQTEFNQIVTYVGQQEAGNLKKLARTYAAMTPADAARILQERDDGWIVRVLMFLSEEETAKLLAALAQPGPENARRAALLSERLRLSVEAPPEGKKSSAVAPPKANAAASPMQELANLNGSPQPGTPADFRKLARSYAVMPAGQAVTILKQLQDEQMAAILAEFTEEETAPFLVELAKPSQAGPQRAARVHGLLLQKLNASNS